VVDVTHDGHDRRTDDEVALVALVGAELQVEGLEQLAVLVLGGDDLHDVVELLAEQLEHLVVDRLGGRDHLAETEEHLHQRGRVDADLLREVGQRGATGETDRLTVALADADAADRRGLHVVELLPALTLRLASPTRRAARTTERTLGASAAAGTTGGAGARRTGSPTAARSAEARAASAARGATAACGCTGTGAAGSSGTATGTAGTSRTTRCAGPAAAEGLRALRHHRGVRAGHAGTRAGARQATGAPGGATVTAGRRPRRPVGAGCCSTGSRRGPTAHALRRGERVVAGPGGAGARSCRARGRGCVAGLGRGRGRGGRLGRRRRGSSRRLLDQRLGLRDLYRLGRRARHPGTGARAGRPGVLGRSADRGGGRGGGSLCGRFGGGDLGRGRAVDGSRCLLRRSLLGGLGLSLGLQLCAVGVVEPLLDGGFDRRRRRLDELAHLLELGQNDLALHAELFGELVDSDLSHASPSGPSRLSAGPLAGVHAHREVLIECS
jgi:hypothetical protein